jgi:hypothetical protein
MESFVESLKSQIPILLSKSIATIPCPWVSFNSDDIFFSMKNIPESLINK